MTLHARGVRVPEDISVITVHDGPIAQIMFPPLTTIDMPVQQMGYEGVQALVQVIQGDAKRVDHQMQPLGLKLRQTTRSIR